MNTQTLPTKLNKEPLVDVVFEIRSRLLCFAISDVHVILLGPIPSSG